MKGSEKMKKLTEAYIGYYSLGMPAGFKVKTFRKINAANSYKLDRVHYVSNAFNFIIGRVVYFSQYKNKPVREIIVTGKDLAKNIGCHPSHAAYVLNSLKELFNLEFDRKGNHHGARTIRINKNMIDFLKIYSEVELQEYMMKHNLMEHGYTLRRLFERRIWEAPDSQLTKEQIAAKKEFVSDPEIQNYHHEVYTSNKSDYARIDFVNKHDNKLNDVEFNQLRRIKAERAEGKLSYYLYKVLIKLEQKISFLTKTVKTAFKAVKKQSRVNGNPEKKETVAHERATAAAVKDPEDDLLLTPKEIVYFFTLWNHMAPDYAMDKIKKITVKRIQSINELVKIYNKENLFEAVKNIKNLSWNAAKYKYRMQLNRFIQSETFLSTLECNSTTSKTSLEDIIEGTNNFRSIKALESSIPNFTELTEAVTYFNQKN
jgi:hypothetical protein